MKVTINDTEYELEVTLDDNVIIVDEIISIDGEEPFTSAPGYFQLVNMLESFCQDILIEEYKRVCELEKDELAIERMITERWE